MSRTPWNSNDSNLCFVGTDDLHCSQQQSPLCSAAAAITLPFLPYIDGRDVSETQERPGKLGQPRPDADNTLAAYNFVKSPTNDDGLPCWPHRPSVTLPLRRPQTGRRTINRSRGLVRSSVRYAVTPVRYIVRTRHRFLEQGVPIKVTLPTLQYHQIVLKCHLVKFEFQTNTAIKQWWKNKKMEKEHVWLRLRRRWKGIVMPSKMDG